MHLWRAWTLSNNWEITKQNKKSSSIMSHMKTNICIWCFWQIDMPITQKVCSSLRLAHSSHAHCAANRTSLVTTYKNKIMYKKKGSTVLINNIHITGSVLFQKNDEVLFKMDVYINSLCFNAGKFTPLSILICTACPGLARNTASGDMLHVNKPKMFLNLQQRLQSAVHGFFILLF